MWATRGEGVHDRCCTAGNGLVPQWLRGFHVPTYKLFYGAYDMVNVLLVREVTVGVYQPKRYGVETYIQYVR